MHISLLACLCSPLARIVGPRDQNIWHVFLIQKSSTSNLATSFLRGVAKAAKCTSEAVSIYTGTMFACYIGLPIYTSQKPNQLVLRTFP